MFNESVFKHLRARVISSMISSKSIVESVVTCLQSSILVTVLHGTFHSMLPLLSLYACSASVTRGPRLEKRLNLTHSSHYDQHHPNRTSHHYG